MGTGTGQNICLWKQKYEGVLTVKRLHAVFLNFQCRYIVQLFFKMKECCFNKLVASGALNADIFKNDILVINAYMINF